jgi:hypothetical protein
MPAEKTLPQATAADLAALAQQYVRQGYGAPGQSVSVHIHLNEHLQLEGVEVVLQRTATAARAVDLPHACLVDIVTLLARTDQRLTTMQLLEGLQAQRTTWGEATVKKILAQAVADELLNNDPRARPPGYGLPGWPVTKEAKE